MAGSAIAQKQALVRLGTDESTTLHDRVSLSADGMSARS
jgi:hypothetical protein